MYTHCEITVERSIVQCNLYIVYLYNLYNVSSTWSTLSTRNKQFITMENCFIFSRIVIARIRNDIPRLFVISNCTANRENIPYTAVRHGSRKREELFVERDVFIRGVSACNKRDTTARRGNVKRLLVRGYRTRLRMERALKRTNPRNTKNNNAPGVRGRRRGWWREIA